jgi:hypothetical protein
MKVTFIVLGVVLLVIGGVWFFQGIGVIPGSFMTGQGMWAGIGAVVAVAGIGLFLVGLLRKPKINKT